MKGGTSVGVRSGQRRVLAGSVFLDLQCIVFDCIVCFIQEGFAQTAALGVSVRSEGGFTTKLQRK